LKIRVHEVHKKRLNDRRKIMPYSIEQPKNWRMKLGNAGRPASLSILISCFLSLFLLNAVLVQAAIVVSPESVNATVTTVQTDPITRTISIVDDGQAAFVWTAVCDQDWMELNPLGGNATTGFDSTTLTIRPEGLSEGTHNGTISIYTSLGDKTVSVTLDIQAQPPPPPPPPPPSPSPLVKVVVSPGELQFYVAQEQLTNPDPITVWVNGFATDDGCATTTFSQEQGNVQTQLRYGLMALLLTMVVLPLPFRRNREMLSLPGLRQRAISGLS
jgi:hypothetical protein